jgi:hypothetical protein
LLWENIKTNQPGVSEYASKCMGNILSESNNQMIVSECVKICMDYLTSKNTIPVALKTLKFIFESQKVNSDYQFQVGLPQVDLYISYQQFIYILFYIILW